MTRDGRKKRKRVKEGPRWRRWAAALPLDRRDRPWLGIGLAAGVLVTLVYLSTNPYPAYGSGLYLQFAKEILAHGYGLPATAAGYTAEGVPIAYPPLQFYVLAVLLDLGADPIALSQYLPAVGVLGSLIPTYLLARDYTGSRPAGAGAAVVVAVNPQLLQWHLSAGGVVRAFGFCYAMFAIYAGYRLFEHESRRAVGFGAVAFGATVLTHPTYSLFVVMSYLLLWVVRDRTFTGLGRGAVVGFGGLGLASPWLFWAVRTHGLDVFTSAAGTHGGVGGGVVTLASASFTLLPLLGAGYLFVVRDDWFIAAWAVAAELLFAQPRFAFTVGAITFAAVAVDVSGRVNWRSPDRRAVVAAGLLVLGTVAGGVYLSHEMTLSADPSSPEFLDDEAVEAMAWAAAETPPDATFVVLGDAAEWFPALTDRTILLGPWGVEWRGSAAYERHLGAFENVSRCSNVGCVEAEMATVGADPDYVYVPKGAYTVRGVSMTQFGTLERSFAESPEWERAYENRGVVVYRAVE